MAAHFRHLRPVLDSQLAGLGLWIDNSNRPPLGSAQMILTHHVQALLP